MSISSDSNVASQSSFVSGLSQPSAVSLMRGLLDSAAEEFILNKDFKTIFETCDTALKDLANSQLEDGRSQDIKAGFCILGIQALAELNEWRCVLPWVLQQYEHQEKIPAKIMQMCIVLHTKVGEAGMLLDVANAWLHSLANNRESEYGTVLELYLLYVLIPLEHLEEAQELIQGRVGICTLTEEQRQTALDLINQKLLQNNLPPNTKNSSATSLQTTNPQGAILKKLGAILKYLYRKLLMTNSGKFHLHKVFLFAILVYMLFTRMDPAYPSSFMWISKLHQLLRQMWTALFAPYYQASRK
uniref:Peroxisome assembly protein 26 n=1 Tax=Neogobius melanostomus TaxID=47308 RepID=A0A8C6WLJ3_9GOBI